MPGASRKRLHLRFLFLFEMLKPWAAGQPLAAGREASEGMCNLCFRAHIGELKSGQKR